MTHAQVDLVYQQLNQFQLPLHSATIRTIPTTLATLRLIRQVYSESYARLDKVDTRRYQLRIIRDGSESERIHRDISTQLYLSPGKQFVDVIFA